MPPTTPDRSFQTAAASPDRVPSGRTWHELPPLPFARLRHRVSRWRARWFGPRMVYGFERDDGVFLPHTRIGSTTCIEAPQRLHIDDHVFIGHHNFIDASGGLAIGEGCQITNHVSLLTHSSHVSLRLHGRSFYGEPSPVGYRRAPTRLGAYVFVGPHSVIAAGAQVGKGALIRAYAYVSGVVPEFAVMATTAPGRPAEQVGDTRETDAAWLDANPGLRPHYDAWARG
jgi:acetyltransferase-like isoleucine patch superfamily enzyme